MKKTDGWLSVEELEEMKRALLDFVKKASRCSYEIPGEAFTVLPAVVDRLMKKED